MDARFDLASAAAVAEEHFARLARQSTSTPPGASFAATQANMAGAAQAAVFSDALLGAIRSRINETKTVTR
jgi:hypothetical protein